jgi:hypothetical protein
MANAVPTPEVKAGWLKTAEIWLQMANDTPQETESLVSGYQHRSNDCLWRLSAVTGIATNVWRPLQIGHGLVFVEIAPTPSALYGYGMGDRSKIERRRSETREHVARMRGQERAENVACSFCSKRQSEVFALFAGPSAVYICDECVSVLAQEVEKRRAT